jgi:LAS superfamily LD-carboxypeptidase LdcB
MLLRIPVSEIFIEPLSYSANKVKIEGHRDNHKENQKEIHEERHKETHKTAHKSECHHFHFSRTLHKLESTVKSFSIKVIDDLHHWLDAIAAEAFLLAKAEAAAHGVHIQISSAGRTYADQSRLYRQLHRHSPVARPGTSNHETGLAIDVANWRQAKPYLLAHGFVHGDGHGPIKNDPWHFKYVGINSEA